MSASRYKEMLQQTLRKLNVAQASASEWRTVASNRLLLLAAVDGALNVQLHGLLKIGTIFGASAEDPGVPVADLSRHSADEMTSFILQKIRAAASFTAHLTNEASSLQSTLGGVLSIALESQDVDRPIIDLKVKDYTAELEDASTPLRSIFHQIEDLPDDDNTASLVTTDSLADGADGRDTGDHSSIFNHSHTLSEQDSDTSPEMRNALSLFRRGRDARKHTT